MYMLKKCTYCMKDHPPEELKPIKGDDSTHLNRKYCPKCLPVVQQAHNNLPWNKKF